MRKIGNNYHRDKIWFNEDDLPTSYHLDDILDPPPAHTVDVDNKFYLASNCVPLGTFAVERPQIIIHERKKRG